MYAQGSISVLKHNSLEIQKIKEAERTFDGIVLKGKICF